MLPRALQWKILKALHDSSHLGRGALTSLAEKAFSGIGLSQTILEITKACNICYRNSPEGKQAPTPPPAIQRRGTYLGEDFNQMPSSQGDKYLLIFIDTFTGWKDAFPTRTRELRKVTKAL